MKRKAECCCQESCQGCQRLCHTSPTRKQRGAQAESGVSSTRRLENKLGNFTHSLGKGEIKDSNDILEKLLIYQPMRKLAEFQLVSKQWSSLISQPTLQEKAVQNCEANNIFISYLKSRHKVGILRVLGDNKYTVSNFDLRPPSSAGPLSLQNILGCCYGLVCLGNNQVGGYMAEEDILLLNPWTRKHRLVKNNIHCGFKRGHYGLGFDHRSHDFKLVKVIPPTMKNCEKKLNPKVAGEVHVVIYSLKNASWREIHIQEWGFTLADYPGIFFKGKIYWVGVVWEMRGTFQTPQGHQNALVSFDLSSETFGCIELPEGLQGGNCSFGIASGKLTACVWGFDIAVWQYIDDNFIRIRLLWAHRERRALLQPLYLTRNITVILHNNKKITIYNQMDRSKLHALGLTKRIRTEGGSVTEGPRMEAVPLLESLFSPNFECE